MDFTALSNTVCYIFVVTDTLDLTWSMKHRSTAEQCFVISLGSVDVPVINSVGVWHTWPHQICRRNQSFMWTVTAWAGSHTVWPFHTVLDLPPTVSMRAGLFTSQQKGSLLQIFQAVLHASKWKLQKSEVCLLEVKPATSHPDAEGDLQCLEVTRWLY